MSKLWIMAFALVSVCSFAHASQDCVTTSDVEAIVEQALDSRFGPGEPEQKTCAQCVVKLDGTVTCGGVPFTGKCLKYIYE